MAHLRVENRALPAGPTVIDEIANATFFAGLMLSVPEEYGDVAKRMSFDDAKSNFFRAARHGLDAQFNWIDGQSYPSSLLILDRLLPLARRGLLDANVDSADVNKYLDVISERVQSMAARCKITVPDARGSFADWHMRICRPVERKSLKDRALKIEDV